MPTVLPGSYPSLGYEATSTDEFGDHVSLASTQRTLVSVSVVMNDWACGNDGTRAPDQACMTTPGATFNHPITLNVYAVDNSGTDPAVGALLGTVTQIFAIPFRPSWDSVMCASFDPVSDSPFGGPWYDPVEGACRHGHNSVITFDFSTLAITLPNEVIFGVAYNTQHYGAAPTGVSGPYNSLNVSVTTDAPSIGTDVEPGTAFWDTSVAGFYCDGGAGGTGTFRRDAGCWTDDGTPTGNPFTPVVRFIAR